VWNIPNGTIISKLGWKNKTSKCSVRSLRYSKDGTVLTAATTDRCIRFWDAGICHYNRVHRNALMGVVNTKTTDVYNIQYTERNLLMASGCIKEKRVLM
jgi:WD40 repeat protein